MIAIGCNITHSKLSFIFKFNWFDANLASKNAAPRTALFLIILIFGII